MKLPWKVEKKPVTPADQKIEEIIKILFPPLELQQENDMKFHIDYGADSNLDAAITDLEGGHNDEITRKTIREIADRLIRVRKLLEAYAQIDPDAKYIIVDNFESEKEIFVDEIGC
jgi:hypothetical protein